MTFLELTDLDTADLALELFLSGDAPTLDEAAALASDLRRSLGDYAAAWDFDAECQRLAAGVVLLPEGDMLAGDGLRI